MVAWLARTGGFADTLAHLADAVRGRGAGDRDLRGGHPDPGGGAAAWATSATSRRWWRSARTGCAVVPLLGGHRGANALAARIAAELGVTAAVTTAGEARLGLALDAPPAGWVLANPENAKAAMAALAGGWRGAGRRATRRRRPGGWRPCRRAMRSR